jgi:hypothetical protein
MRRVLIARLVLPSFLDGADEETHKGDTVTHVQDFNCQQVLTKV